jgi:hypothetical protein
VSENADQKALKRAVREVVQEMVEVGEEFTFQEFTEYVRALPNDDPRKRTIMADVVTRESPDGE